MSVTPSAPRSEDEKVSIGRLKRDISELVNRVAFGGERIVLTSRGNPKAALVSLDDYDQLMGGEKKDRVERMRRWVKDASALADQIQERREKEGFAEPIDAVELLEASRRDLEMRGQESD